MSYPNKLEETPNPEFQEQIPSPLNQPSSELPNDPSLSPEQKRLYNVWKSAIEYDKKGSFERDSGNLEEATEYFQKSISLRLEDFEKSERAEGSNYDLEKNELDCALMNSWINLASLLKTQGRFVEANETYHHILSVIDGAFERLKNHERFESEKNNLEILKATILNDYGTTSEAVGNIMEAQNSLSQGIRLLEIKGESELLNTMRGNLGLLYENLGNYDAAEEFHLKSLKHLPSIEVWNHPHFATSLHPNIYANIHISTNIIQNLGEKTPEEEQYKRTLADWTERMRQQEIEAKSDIPITERILSFQEKNLGRNHPKLALVIFYLASLYRRIGDYQKSIELLERLYSIFHQKYGESHCNIATLFCHLALTHISQNNLFLAEKYFKEALLIRHQLLGPNHIHTAVTGFDLGFVFFKLFKFDDFLAITESSKKVFESSLGKDHPFTVLTVNLLTEMKNQTKQK